MRPAFRSPAGWRPVVTACRPLHWIKNLLIFVPLLTSHNLRPDLVLRSLVMFVAFWLGASGVYLLNDVVDLESDRRHERK